VGRRAALDLALALRRLGPHAYFASTSAHTHHASAEGGSSDSDDDDAANSMAVSPFLVRNRTTECDREQVRVGLDEGAGEVAVERRKASWRKNSILRATSAPVVESPKRSCLL